MSQDSQKMASFFPQYQYFNINNISTNHITINTNNTTIIDTIVIKRFVKITNGSNSSDSFIMKLPSIETTYQFNFQTCQTFVDLQSLA